MIISYEAALRQGISRYLTMLEHNPNSIIAHTKLEQYKHKLFRLINGYEYNKKTCKVGLK
jgi:hypothetical protein